MRSQPERGVPGLVQMTGPDTRMDERCNPLPIQCPHCTLPDLDFVSKPYLLARGIAAPAESAPAAVGNFLVRDRVRRILEVIVPKACTFVQTAEKKSKKPTEWWLAVPKHVVDIPGLPDRSRDRERCKRCGAPKLGYYPFAPVEGNPRQMRYVGLDRFDGRGIDVLKSRQWHAVDTVEHQFEEALKYTPKGEPPPPWSRFGSVYGVTEPPTHPQRWTRIHLDRDLFFSVRLEQLLYRAKVKGQLVRSANFKNVGTSAADDAWIAESLRILADSGLTDAKPSAPAAQTASHKWFKKYISKNALKRKPAKIDTAAIEEKQKLRLPQDYKDFITAVGPKSFGDVMEIDGFTAQVLPPMKLDFKSYRLGRWKRLGVESKVDGVAFADTDHGDVFVFDIAVKDGDYPVFWYDHEQNAVEPFANDFAQCIRRFDERT